MLSRPPCSRYENPENADDGDERVIAVWAYAMGLLGGSQKNSIAAKIARLHDHKGILFVATRETLPEDCRWAFRRAWAEMGSEVEENVEFCLIDSEDWLGCWAAKRFESTWTP